MKKDRKYVSNSLKIESWLSIENYFIDLQNREINSLEDLKNWLKDRSELEAVLEEEMAWRYIKMNCNTQDESLSEKFNYFVAEISPKITELSFELNKILYSNKYTKLLKGDDYKIMLRSVKNSIELFREKNIPIQAKLQQEEQEYGKISAAMTINYQGKELTMQQAANYLEENDRELRENIYNLISTRRLQDKNRLNSLILSLIQKRQQLASNADFDNYRDYMFKSMERFDYTVEACYNFHEAMKLWVVPLIDKIDNRRKEKLSLDVLKPWDLSVSEDNKASIRPFDTGDELIEKTIECFNKIKPEYGNYLKIMKENKYLDLDSRIGKAPGGFNYPLYESNIPFIFMNASGNVRDIETMVHEGGHAIHSFLSKDLELLPFKELPSEVAELASMSMELISMEYWDVFFKNKEELNRIKRFYLQRVIKTLSWIALIDKFQHLLYTEKNISENKIIKLWQQIAKDFMGSVVNWDGLEQEFNHYWQKQLHIFEVPFYYIEYGFAQLGAIAMWRNYKTNPDRTINDYENALKLGYTKTIPEIYKAAGIEFNFSKSYVEELMLFVESELHKLENE